MVRRWCNLQRSRWAAFLLACLSLLSLLVPPPNITPTADAGSNRVSVCRPDMAVTRLPPMPDDNQTMVHALFKYLTEPNEGACARVLRFGGMSHLDHRTTTRLDGDKFVCVDPEFSLLTTSQCLVYSFGISDDWSFDYDMESFGCTVFAFDPSTNDTDGYQNGTIYFNSYGIGGHDGTEGSFPVRTLDTISSQLGHARRTVHYLKLDVEDSEWAVFEQQVARGHQSTLFRNVEQLGVELHFFTHMPVEYYFEFYRRAYQSFLRLQEMGFCLFAHEANAASQAMSVPGFAGTMPSAMEVAWLKSRCADSAGRGQQPTAPG